jgi:hypothetical protein
MTARVVGAIGPEGSHLPDPAPGSGSIGPEGLHLPDPEPGVPRSPVSMMFAAYEAGIAAAVTDMEAGKGKLLSDWLTDYQQRAKGLEILRQAEALNADDPVTP